MHEARKAERKREFRFLAQSKWKKEEKTEETRENTNKFPSRKLLRKCGKFIYFHSFGFFTTRELPALPNIQ
jgi:hypothetical protein